jgi:hypothetical protein
MKKRDIQKEITFESYLQKVASAKNNFESLNEDEYEYEYFYDEERAGWFKRKFRKIKKALGFRKSTTKGVEKLIEKKANLDKLAVQKIVKDTGGINFVINWVRNAYLQGLKGKNAIVAFFKTVKAKLFKKSVAPMSDSYQGKIKNRNIFSEDYELYNESIDISDVIIKPNLVFHGIMKFSIKHNIDGNIRVENYTVDERNSKIIFTGSTPALPAPVDYKAQIWANIYKDSRIYSAATSELTVTDWNSPAWVQFKYFLNNSNSSKNTRDMADNVAEIKGTTSKIEATTGKIEATTGEIDKTTKATDAKVDALTKSNNRIFYALLALIVLVLIFFGVYLYFHSQDKAEFKAFRTEVKNEFGNMKTQIETVGLKVDDLKADMDSKFENIEKEFADLNQKIDVNQQNLENKLEIILKNEQDILKDTGQLKQDVNTVFKYTQANNGFLNSISKKVIKIKTELGNIKKDVIEGKMNDIKNFADLRNIVNSIQKGQSITNENIISLTRIVNEGNEEQIKILKEMGVNVNTMKSDLQELKSSVERVELNTEEIKDDVNAIKANEQLKFKIENLEWYQKIFKSQEAFKNLMDAREKALLDQV